MQHDKRTDIDCRQRCLIAFDLDDTLFKERDYLRSGHRVLARKLAGESGADERATSLKVRSAETSARTCGAVKK